MAPPLYFFPNVAKAKLVQGGKFSTEVLGPRNLTRTFSDVSVGECFVEDLQGTGPGGSAGVIMRAFATNGERPTRTGYYPKNELQEWTHFSEADGDFWVGLDSVLRPTPVDLQRKTQVAGYPVTLGKHDWTIPVIRDPEGGTGLPRKWIMEASGDVAEEVEDAYRELWESFVGVVDIFFNPEDPAPAGVFQIDRREAMAHCLDALTINYRIGRAEQNLLGIVTADNWPSILGATVDIGAFYAVYNDAQDAKKKRDLDRATRPESPDTDPGEVDDSQDIDRADPS